MNYDWTPAETLRHWALLSVLTGATGIACYFGSVVFKPFPWGVGRLLFFSIGPLTVISVIGLYEALKPSAARIPLLLGTVLTAIGGVIVNLMAVVQDMQFNHFGEQIRGASSETTVSSLERVLWGVNVVQSGFDVSWDIFLSLGTILLAVAIWMHPLFGKVLGGLGLTAAAAALTLNLVAYPSAPSESGLVDLGPAVGLWHGVLLIRVYVVRDRLGGIRGEPKANAT